MSVYLSRSAQLNGRRVAPGCVECAKHCQPQDSPWSIDLQRGERLLQTISQPESTHATLRPLCVDLDGTLVKSDTLVDSLLVLMRTHPALAFELPGQLLHGKAAFKAFVTAIRRARRCASALQPQAAAVSSRAARAGPRTSTSPPAPITALAHRVAAHLESSPTFWAPTAPPTSLATRSSTACAAGLARGEFDYIGNATPDLPLLAQRQRTNGRQSHACASNASSRSRHPAGHASFTIAAGFFDLPLRAMRPHQWAKNLLIFLPLLLSHVIAIDRLLDRIAGLFLLFARASATYIVNDLLDIESDRRHPQKRFRPFAVRRSFSLDWRRPGHRPSAFGHRSARLLPLGFSGMAASLSRYNASLLHLLSSEFRSWMC